MTTAHKIANRHYEEEASWTTRDAGGTLSRRARQVKTARNRAAKRSDTRNSLKDQENA